MYYIQFDENGIQEQLKLSEESPGPEWYAVGENVDNKYYKLSSGAAIAMTEKELEDYRFDLKRTWVIQDARNKRDRALIESDWTQLSTSPLSDAKKTEWETYRQALRDLPNNIAEDLTYTFPEVPV
jgi:hypothetical protein